MPARTIDRSRATSYEQPNAAFRSNCVEMNGDRRGVRLSIYSHIEPHRVKPQHVRFSAKKEREVLPFTFAGLANRPPFATRLPERPQFSAFISTKYVQGCQRVRKMGMQISGVVKVVETVV